MSDTPEKKLPKELKDILKYVPEDKKKETIRKVSLSISKKIAFSGPLPHPSILGEYNEVVKDGAERILKMAECQSKHRRALEDHAIKEELSQSRRGQTFAFVLAIIFVCISAWLAYTGHDMVAGILGTTTIVAIVTAFIIGKKRQKE